MTIDQYDSILILAEQESNEVENGPSDMESSDSRSLASLLLVSDLQRELSKHGSAELCHPISEILDTRTSHLLHDVENIGYVLSNQIVSAAISQIAECRDMNQVLGELLRAEGCNVNIEPITNYIAVEEEPELSFWEVALRARKRKHLLPDGEECCETAIGYKPHAVPWQGSAATALNPPKKAEKRVWHAEDVLIVLYTS